MNHFHLEKKPHRKKLRLEKPMTKMKAKADQLWVWLDDPAFGPLQHIGTLSRGDRGGIRFSYEREWLNNSIAFPLDLKLDLAAGELFPKDSKLGGILDSCPDRWGQFLMKCWEVVEAGEEGRVPRTLGTWDFLVGVQDLTRMGALRFSRPNEDVFEADKFLAAPPFVKLAELQAIAFELTKKKLDDLDKLRAWLKVLVGPGASLGGARPKANLVRQDGDLWIAKFPSSYDDYDVSAWEKLLHDLAQRSGITVPESHLLRIGSGHRTFVVRRFDRKGDRRRFFVSAMTMLDRIDTDDASYLELAEILSTFGEPDHIGADLRELFTRVVFNVITANRDDHLRNHGFLRSPAGWRLAPAFDMNPSFKKDEHVLALNLECRLPDLDVVLSTADYYRLSLGEAESIVVKVCKVVGKWKAHAKRLGLRAHECAAAEHLFLV